MPRANSSVGVRPSRPAVVHWDALGASHGAGAPAFTDRRLAEIFRNMRRMLNVSIDVVAADLRTTRGVIGALEAGAVYALPPWGETHRVVVTYAQRAGIDARPILARLEGYLIYNAGSQPAAALPAPRARAATDVPAFKKDRRPAKDPLAFEKTPLSHPPRLSRKRRRRRARRLLAMALLLAVVGGTIVAARLRPELLLEAARQLPQQVATSALSSAELLVFRTAPRQDGLRWVDMADPRIRKADKLRSAGQ